MLVSGVLLLLGRRSPQLNDAVRERIVPEREPQPRAELVAIACFGASSICAIAFVAVYALDRLPNHTQLLGGALGLAFCLLAAGLIVTAKRLVSEQQVEHDYPENEHQDEQETIVQIAEESGDSLTRRRFFKLALAGSGGALGLALITPAASLGPLLDVNPYFGTPWRRGRRLVDETGKPYRASDIEPLDLYTAFPEHADKENIGASIVLVRLEKDQLALPPELASYPAHGIVAFSKICTHAGCAISLYRAPLFQPDEPRPALVCPCHYSTFDPATGGSVTFGPAGRDLPMLPLYVDAQGYLRAKGNFDGPVGPSWWGVRMWKAQS